MDVRHSALDAEKNDDWQYDEIRVQARLDQRQVLGLQGGVSLVSLAGMGDDDKADHLRVDPTSEQLTCYLKVDLPKRKPEGPTTDPSKLGVVASRAEEDALVLFKEK